MRLRTVLLAIATALVVLFALLNWEEITRPTPLNFGFRTVTAPVGLILLGVLALAFVIFLVAMASAHTRHLMEARQHARALQAQRDLAERAEASRFSDLRQMLDTHIRESRQQEGRVGGEFEQSLSRVRTHIDQLQHYLTMRMGEMEARLESRFGHAEPLHHEPLRPEPLRNEPLRNEPLRGEPVRAEPAYRGMARQEYVRGEPVREPVAPEAVRTEPAPGEVVGEPVRNEPPGEPRTGGVRRGPFDRVR